MKHYIVALLLAIVSLFSLSCEEKLPEPPIAISWRDSLLGYGRVLQLRNTSSDKHLLCVLHVENKLEHSERNVKIPLEPSQCMEVGILEIDWDFMSGERGYVDVEGGFHRVEFTVP